MRSFVLVLLPLLFGAKCTLGHFRKQNEPIVAKDEHTYARFAKQASTASSSGSTGPVFPSGSVAVGASTFAKYENVFRIVFTEGLAPLGLPKASQPEGYTDLKAFYELNVNGQKDDSGFHQALMMRPDKKIDTDPHLTMNVVEQIFTSGPEPTRVEFDPNVETLRQEVMDINGLFKTGRSDPSKMFLHRFAFVYKVYEDPTVPTVSTLRSHEFIVFQMGNNGKLVQSYFRGYGLDAFLRGRKISVSDGEVANAYTNLQEFLLNEGFARRLYYAMHSTLQNFHDIFEWLFWMPQMEKSEIPDTAKLYHKMVECADGESIAYKFGVMMGRGNFQKAGSVQAVGGTSASISTGLTAGLSPSLSASDDGSVDSILK